MKHLPLSTLIVFLLLVSVVRSPLSAQNGQQIRGNGIIEATEVDITTKVTGRIASLTVREGMKVQAGQLLATLEAGDLEGQLDQAVAGCALAAARLAELENGTRPEEIRRARALLESARSTRRQIAARHDLVRAGPRRETLDQLRAAVKQAETSIADIEADLRRTQILEKQGAMTPQQLEKVITQRELARENLTVARKRLAEGLSGARPQERSEAEAALDAADAQVDAASATLDLALAGARREVIDAARAQLALARGQEKTARAMLDYTRIVSPLNGRVTQRSLEPGELVTPGLPIVRVIDLAEVWLKVYVAEKQVGFIKPGQEADVTADSFPGRTFRGKVIEIAEIPEFTPKNVQTIDERTKLVFWVKVAIENPDLDLKPGMPGDAIIQTGTPVK